MDQTVSSLNAAREVARYLVAKADNIDDATPEDIDLLASDLVAWSGNGRCSLDEAAAQLVATLQGRSRTKGSWRTALAVYIADLRRQGAQGVEYRQTV